jgi:hypothetical protein
MANDKGPVFLMALLLRSIKGGHGYDKSSKEVCAAVRILYRKGVLMKDMATGEYKVTMLGDEIIKKTEGIHLGKQED